MHCFQNEICVKFHGKPLSVDTLVIVRFRNSFYKLWSESGVLCFETFWAHRADRGSR
jgi:hypothetical protein